MTDPHDRPIDATAGPDKTQEAHDTPEITALSAGPRQSFTIRERIALTYEYHGGWSLVLRVLTFPLRFTPLKRFLDRRPSTGKARRVAARRWYRELGRPVTIVIPSYKDAEDVATLVASLRRTTDNKQVRIVVADDASGPEHVAALRRIAGIDVVVGESNAGFAANVNRGIRAAAGSDDVVVLNSDVIAERDWLESLQYAASTRMDDVGIVGAKLLYPDGRIQFGGTVRNLGAPEWFDHRYRFRPSDWGPANVPGPVLAVSGACMYLTRELIDQVGLFDESYPMAYEDVDLCLRGWQAGFRTLYWPAAELRHMESVTRGTEVGERERTSQRMFWQSWGTFFDARDVRTANDALRVVYVTEDTGIGGGHRDIFEHLNGLLDRGHDAQLWTLGGPPDWFELRAPVHSFEDYDELIRALGSCEGHQDRHVVEHVAGGVGSESDVRDPGLFRPGHRDQLLPGQSDASRCRACLLPARVSLYDDLVLEPRPSPRTRAGRDFDPARHRPCQLPTVARCRAPPRHDPGRRSVQSVEEPTADDRGLAPASRATSGAVSFRS